MLWYKLRTNISIWTNVNHDKNNLISTPFQWWVRLELLFVHYTVASLNSWYALRLSQPLWMVSRHFFDQKINWNRAWHVKYGWNDLPIRSKFLYSIQWIGPWKYEQNWKTNFSHSLQKKIDVSIFFIQRWRCVNQHFVIIHTKIYQIGAFEFILVRIQDNWHIKLAVAGDNTGTSCNSPVVLWFN